MSIIKHNTPNWHRERIPETPPKNNGFLSRLSKVPIHIILTNLSSTSHLNKRESFRTCRASFIYYGGSINQRKSNLTSIWLFPVLLGTSQLCQC